MLGKISLQYESSYKNISTAKFYFKWLSLLQPRLLQFYFLRYSHWKNKKNCHLCTFCLFSEQRFNFKAGGFFSLRCSPWEKQKCNPLVHRLFSLSKWAILFLLCPLHYIVLVLNDSPWVNRSLKLILLSCSSQWDRTIIYSDASKAFLTFSVISSKYVYLSHPSTNSLRSNAICYHNRSIS